MGRQLVTPGYVYLSESKFDLLCKKKKCFVQRNGEQLTIIVRNGKSAKYEKIKARIAKLKAQLKKV